MLAALGLASSQLQLSRMGIWLCGFHGVEFAVYGFKPEKANAFTWVTSLTGLVHHFIICSLCFKKIFNSTPEIEGDKMYGADDGINKIFAIATAYFLWDLSVCLRYGIKDAGFIVHAFICMLCYLFGQGPYLHWYGIRFLLFEISSIFLQIRSVLSCLEIKGLSIKYAELGFAFSFFVVRMLYGIPLSIAFWKDSIALLRSGKAHSLFVVWFYFVANIIVNILNTFWFSLILKKLRKQLKTG